MFAVDGHHDSGSHGLSHTSGLMIKPFTCWKGFEISWLSSHQDFCSDAIVMGTGCRRKWTLDWATPLHPACKCTLHIFGALEANSG